ncbi:MAG: BLUF domain-containing protein [Burkholderiales bacterium]|nr:BLUF domain-containing protein [Burkholderiales bacterium]
MSIASISWNGGPRACAATRRRDAQKIGIPSSSEWRDGLFLHPVSAARRVAPSIRGSGRAMMLVRHFYVSQIAGDVTEVDVQVILGTAQMTNRRLDLTGMLAQGEGYFAQVLEGRSVAVAALMARIRRDPRHRDVRTLLEEPIQRRQFARWAMGLVQRDDMSAAMRDAHRHGCPDELHARRLMQALLDSPP